MDIKNPYEDLWTHPEEWRVANAANKMCELYQLYESPDALTEIKIIDCIKWTGHVQRTDDNITIKK